MSGNALTFELSADSVGLERGLKSAEKGFSSLAHHATSDLKKIVAGYASYEAFKHLVGHTVEASKEIRNFSKQAGITTDEVQYLQKAASKVGLEFEDFQTGLSKMGQARRDAATNDQKLLNFFNQWGISLEDLENPQLRNIDLMKKMAAAMQGVELSPAQRTQFKDVFGRAGEKLIAAIEQLGHLGTIKIIKEEDIEAIYRADKALAQLRKNWEKMAAPHIGRTAQAASNAINFLTDEQTKTERKGAEKIADHYAEKKDTVGVAMWNDYRASLGIGSPEEQQEALETLLRYATGNSFRGKGRVPEGLLTSGGFNPKMFEQGAHAGHAGQEQHGPMQRGSEEHQKFETTRNEQLRRYYDFLDQEAELAERVRKINFDMLTPKEQQLDLQKRINEKLERAHELETGRTTITKPDGSKEVIKSEPDPRTAQNLKTEALELNAQLLGTARKPDAVNTPAADSAAQAGLFIGGAVGFNPMQFNDSSEQLRVMRDVERNTAAIAEKIQPPPPPPRSIYQD